MVIAYLKLQMLGKNGLYSSGHPFSSIQLTSCNVLINQRIWIVDVSSQLCLKTSAHQIMAAGL